MLSFGDSLLESNHDLYRSPLHLVQLILRSSCLRHEFIAWENWGVLSEREGAKGWHQSVSSLSEWHGWVPFNFLVVRYWNKWLCHCWQQQNVSSDTSGNLPLNCVPFIIFSLHQGCLILVVELLPICKYVWCVYMHMCAYVYVCVWFLLFLNDKFPNNNSMDASNFSFGSLSLMWTE